jgi:hypothetical protein
LTKPFRSFLVSRKSPQGTANNERQRANYTSGWTAQIVEQTLKGPGPWHDCPATDWRSVGALSTEDEYGD